MCSNSEYQSTGYEETLRSCKGLIRHFAFEIVGKVHRGHVITCCILIRKKIKNPSRNKQKIWNKYKKYRMHIR